MAIFGLLQKDPMKKSDITTEATVLREVMEETWYECLIIPRIPGEFESDTCKTKYYLMKPTGRIIDFDKETQEVGWFNPDEAFEKIELTKTEKGRRRYKEALIRALQTMKELNETCGWIGKREHQITLHLRCGAFAPWLSRSIHRRIFQTTHDPA